jgi:hypothetical protein
MGSADLDDVGERLRLLIERPVQVAERRQQKLTDLAGRRDVQESYSGGRLRITGKMVPAKPGLAYLLGCTAPRAQAL